MPLCPGWALSSRASGAACSSIFSSHVLLARWVALGFPLALTCLNESKFPSSCQVIHQNITSDSRSNYMLMINSFTPCTSFLFQSYRAEEMERSILDANTLSAGWINIGISKCSVKLISMNISRILEY